MCQVISRVDGFHFSCWMVTSLRTSSEMGRRNIVIYYFCLLQAWLVILRLCEARKRNNSWHNIIRNDRGYFRISYREHTYVHTYAHVIYALCTPKYDEVTRRQRDRSIFLMGIYRLKIDRTSYINQCIEQLISMTYELFPPKLTGNVRVSVQSTTRNTVILVLNGITWL